MMKMLRATRSTAAVHWIDIFDVVFIKKKIILIFVLFTRVWWENVSDDSRICWLNLSLVGSSTISVKYIYILFDSLPSHRMHHTTEIQIP